MGVFANKWAETKLLTDGFIGAKYKGFASASDAWKFVLNENKSIQAPKFFNEVNYLSDNEIEVFRVMAINEVRNNKKSRANETHVANSIVFNVVTNSIVSIATNVGLPIDGMITVTTNDPKSSNAATNSIVPSATNVDSPIDGMISVSNIDPKNKTEYNPSHPILVNAPNVLNGPRKNQLK